MLVPFERVRTATAPSNVIRLSCVRLPLMFRPPVVRPKSLLTELRSKAWLSLLAETVTPGTTAPEASLTKPEICALSDCPYNCVEIARARANRHVDITPTGLMLPMANLPVNCSRRPSDPFLARFNQCGPLAGIVRQRERGSQASFLIAD